jgi:hypothetical protein
MMHFGFKANLFNVNQSRSFFIKRRTKSRLSEPIMLLKGSWNCIRQYLLLMLHLMTTITPDLTRLLTRLGLDLPREMSTPIH